jgi:hypothetical protein
VTDENASPPADVADEAANAGATPAPDEAADPLAPGVDVRTRLRSRISDTKNAATSHVQSVRDRFTGDEGKPTQGALAAGGGMLAIAVALFLAKCWLRASRRSKRRR